MNKERDINVGAIEKWLQKAKRVVTLSLRRKALEDRLCPEYEPEGEVDSDMARKYLASVERVAKSISQLKESEEELGGFIGITALLGKFPKEEAVAIALCFLTAGCMTSDLNHHLNTVSDLMSVVCPASDPMSMVTLRDAFGETGLLAEYVEVQMGTWSTRGVHEFRANLTEESLQKMLGGRHVDSRITALREARKKQGGCR